MSNFENVKIIGAVLAVGILVMLSGFITELVYGPEQLEEHAYVVATVAESAADLETKTAEPESKPEPEAVAALIAAADTGAGRKEAKNVPRATPRPRTARTRSAPSCGISWAARSLPSRASPTPAG